MLSRYPVKTVGKRSSTFVTCNGKKLPPPRTRQLHPQCPQSLLHLQHPLNLLHLQSPQHLQCPQHLLPAQLKSRHRSNQLQLNQMLQPQEFLSDSSEKHRKTPFFF